MRVLPRVTGDGSRALAWHTRARHRNVTFTRQTPVRLEFACPATVDYDPIERLRLLARERLAVKVLVIGVVAIVVGASMGLGAALFSLSAADSLWFGVLGGFGAVPAVLLFLR